MQNRNHEQHCFRVPAYQVAITGYSVADTSEERVAILSYNKSKKKRKREVIADGQR